MSSAFNDSAANYDQQFTDTYIGRMQRDRVWKYLKNTLLDSGPKRILELNCGTGEDAVYLARLGHSVLATDLSEEMLSQTRVKIGKDGLTDQVKVKQLDLSDPKLDDEGSFDMIFSNFGGLNCLNSNELRSLFIFCSNNLKRDGICVFVLMPKETLLEKLYRMWTGEMAKYQQRKSDHGVEVNVGGLPIATHFYNLSDIKELCADLRLTRTMPIGFIPSYFNNVAILPLLKLLDTLAVTFQLPVDRSDHFLVQFSKSE